MEAGSFAQLVNVEKRCILWTVMLELLGTTESERWMGAVDEASKGFEMAACRLGGKTLIWKKQVK